MHVKMKFTDKHGNSKTLGRQQEFKSASIPASVNPDWAQQSVLFKAQDGFEKAEFLRIEICLDDFTTNFIIGTCFIPLALFRRKSKELSFPMTRYKNVSVTALDSSVVNSLGEMVVRIHRIEEDSTSPAVMCLRPSLMESNIFNTRWFCECVAAGAVNTENLKDIEQFSLLAAQEGLELVAAGNTVMAGADQSDIHSSPAPSVKDNYSERGSIAYSSHSASSLALTEDWGKDDPLAEPSVEVNVEVFENQQRQPYYPFDWSNKAYTRPSFSDITYTVAYKFDSISKAVPPPNFAWSSEWCIDRKYTGTDDNGWSYGYTFGKLLANYKNNKSHTKPLKMMARRRKWVRKATAIDRNSMGGANRNAMYNFERNNSVVDESSLSAGPQGRAQSPRNIPGATPPPKGANAPSPDLKLASWRNDLLLTAPNTLMAVCQERSTSQGNILIPWDQVASATVITPSVLSIYVQVNRYLYDKNTSNKGFFRPADVEIFVTNCPAGELKSMIDERKWFDAFKSKIRKLVSSGTSTGLCGAEELLQEQRMSQGSLDGAVPDTEELSEGSELVADLDQNSIALEARTRELEKIIAAKVTSTDKAAVKELSIIMRRDCRLRMYMAALFGVGLKGNHNFEETEIRDIMERDFKLSQNINQKTEILTANNRIEFYLDTAEKRIRDAVLCGWNYRKTGQLERCLEIFANGYFIEIVGLLGTFFEDKGAVSVKVSWRC